MACGRVGRGPKQSDEKRSARPEQMLKEKYGQ
eukprot:COSAG06_NODE_62497_length_265_cov_0.530120_1_plen_31_part_10